MPEFAEKAEERAEIARAVAAFLAGGGVVRVMPRGASMFDPDSLPEDMRPAALRAARRRLCGWGSGHLAATIAANDKTLGEMVSQRFSRAAICKGLRQPLANWHKIVTRAERAGIVLPEYLLSEVL